MDNETRREIVKHAVRWAANMLVEVVGNHARALTAGEREALKTACTALSVTFAAAGPAPEVSSESSEAPTSGLDLRPRPCSVTGIDGSQCEREADHDGPHAQELAGELDFEAKLQRWLGEAQSQIDAHFRRSLPNLRPDVLSIDPGGRKYLRIVTTSGGGEGQRSVFCFVERGTGNVFKAESWKKPAKHVRGNIAEHASKACTVYGANYMR